MSRTGCACAGTGFRALPDGSALLCALSSSRYVLLETVQRPADGESCVCCDFGACGDAREGRRHGPISAPLHSPAQTAHAIYSIHSRVSVRRHPAVDFGPPLRVRLGAVYVAWAVTGPRALSASASSYPRPPCELGAIVIDACPHLHRAPAGRCVSQSINFRTRRSSAARWWSLFNAPERFRPVHAAPAALCRCGVREARLRGEARVERGDPRMALDVYTRESFFVGMMTLCRVQQMTRAPPRRGCGLASI